jgi:uncharacterized membrane protein
MIEPLNFIIGVVWGVLTLGAWSVVTWRHFLRWREYHDQRARIAFLSVFALWVTAALFGIFLFVSALVDMYDVFGPGSRGILLGMAMGAFTGAGILAVFEDER